MAPLHVLPWEQEHVTHTRLKLNFYTHKPSFQCYTTCEVILIQPKTSHPASRVLWHYVHNLSGVLNISYLFLIIFKLEGIGCCRTQRSAALWRHAGPSPYNGGRGGDWDKWRQKVWDGSILGTSVDSSPCQLEAAVENRAASMNNGSNRSIDPSCTDQPPLAIDIILSEYIFSPPAKLILHKRSLWEYHCSHRTSDLMDLTVAPVQCHFRFKVTQVQQRRDQFKIHL